MSKSFGQIFATDNLGIGGRVESGWFDDSYDVWDMLFSVISDQNVDFYIYRRDEELVEDTGDMMFTSSISSSYKTYMTGQRPGYSFKIVAFNNSGVVVNNLKVRMQVITQS